ncbi:MAG TPA: NrsF family protein [Stellaceae bacterium]|nr:NrsF family protein [Stellaceae bacterium]
MIETIDQTIGKLVADATPVRRLRAPAARAALWLVSVAAVSTLAVLLFSNLAVFGERIENPKLAIEMAAAAATGVCAVLAAFELSVPDRHWFWMLLPLPPLAVWIASSGYSCYDHWLRFGPDGWEIGESVHCFRFIVGVSVPLAATLLLLLRRAMPLAPVRVAAMGGLGVGALAAAVLQFFHPFDVTFMDLGVHAAAVAIVVGAASLAGGYRSVWLRT